MNTDINKSGFIKKYKRSVNEIASDKLLLFLYCIMPLIIFILIPLIYCNSVLRDIPVAIVDKDHSEISTMLIKYIESSASMKITKYCNDESEIKELLRNGVIQGAFVFPQDMSESIMKGIPANAGVFINSSNLIISNNILNDAAKIIKTVSAGVVLKKFRSAGMDNEQAINAVIPIKLETQILYNPVYSYTDYLIPGVCAYVYMMIILSGAIMAFHGDYRNFLAKASAHLGFHYLNNIIFAGLIFYLFKVNIAGSALLLTVYLFFFSTVAFSIGIMFSVLFSKQMMALQATLFIFTPAFIYSGLTFPLWAMPKVHQVIAQFIPFTSFMSGLQKIYLINADFKTLLPELFILLIFLSVSSIVSAAVIEIKKRSVFRGLK